MPRWLVQMLLAVAFSPITYFAQRLLVALGVPFDHWAQSAAKAMNLAINWEVMLWGSALLLSFLLLLLEGRLSLLERTLYFIRPFKLDENGIRELEGVMDAGNALLNEFNAGRVDMNSWRGRVVQWNDSTYEHLRARYPRVESFMYRTVNLYPASNQDPRLLIGILNGRMNKLRRIAGRHIPPRMIARR